MLRVVGLREKSSRVTCMLPSSFCTMLREKLTRVTWHEKLTRCCAKNRCCKLSRVTSPLDIHFSTCFVTKHAGADLGGGCMESAPPLPLEMTGQLSNTTGILQKCLIMIYGH